MITKKITQLKKKFKLQLGIATGRITPLKKEVKYHHEWYGNSYGGFYVHPSKLNEQSIVYSFGIGEDISFDTAIIEKHKCKVFGFDPTPKSIQWVRKQQLPPNFVFYGYGINSKTGNINFNLPRNHDHVSGSIIMNNNLDQHNMVSVPMKRFNDIAQELGHHHIDILKMDIEGTEYDVIADILSSPVVIDQLLVELHERFFKDGKSKTKEFMKIIKSRGYSIFGISDTMQEISFIKN